MADKIPTETRTVDPKFYRLCDAEGNPIGSSTPLQVGSDGLTYPSGVISLVSSIVASGVAVPIGVISGTGYVSVMAKSDNVGNVVVGASGISSDDGFLEPGLAMPFSLSNLSILHIMGDNVGDGVSVLGAYI